MRSPKKRGSAGEGGGKSGVKVLRPAHTPGPWQACKDGACSCRQVWSMPGDVPVFTARPDSNVNIGMAHHKWGDSPELIYGIIPPAQTEANARLIAAAPEMLAALEAYERLDNQHANCEECDGEVQPELCAACFPYADDARLKMRAALAKVRRAPEGPLS